MARVWLWVGLLTLIGGGAVQAASDQTRGGTIIDPIVSSCSWPLPYSGNDLESYADLSEANLAGVRLYSAELGNLDDWANARRTGAKDSISAVGNDGHAISTSLFPAGLDRVWRDNTGRVTVPEPTTALLAGFDLRGLGVPQRGRTVDLNRWPQP